MIFFAGLFGRASCCHVILVGRLKNWAENPGLDTTVGGGACITSDATQQNGSPGIFQIGSTTVGRRVRFTITVTGLKSYSFHTSGLRINIPSYQIREIKVEGLEDTNEVCIDTDNRLEIHHNADRTER